MNNKRSYVKRTLVCVLGLMCLIPMTAFGSAGEEGHAAELVEMAETRFSDGRTEAGLKICDMVLEKYPQTKAAAKAGELKRKAMTSTPISTPIPTTTTTTSITNGDEAHAAELLGMAQTRLSDGRTEAGLKILDMILSKYANTSSASKAASLMGKYSESGSTSTSTTTSSGGSRTEEEHAAELVDMAETRLADGRTEAAVKICEMVLEKYSHTRAAVKAKEIKRIAEGD
ncbi:hypothetical protein GF359_07260 [candidate division WOR-3 bacterium]|uniref:Tetratricopeptide repeat protein n=1 Tax=candidate division WOR-3 bacterium TaxID=2052148 RepID=A0A9D5K9K0_UNCW3|nr:hypothetical protein [candidate division WOR-3 bacterium]MBD3364998.1 hypothetical protein [candidate division WOR-3 bacterium]